MRRVVSNASTTAIVSPSHHRLGAACRAPPGTLAAGALPLPSRVTSAVPRPPGRLRLRTAVL